MRIQMSAASGCGRHPMHTPCRTHAPTTYMHLIQACPLPLSQAQVPSLHTPSNAGHFMPHSPQLFLSVIRSLHVHHGASPHKV